MDKKDAKLAALKEIMALCKQAMSEDLRGSDEPDESPEPKANPFGGDDDEEKSPFGGDDEDEPSDDKKKLLALKEKFKK